MAITNRTPPTGTVVHSDHGSQPEFNRLSQHCQLTEPIVVDRWAVMRGSSASAIAEAA